jgi:ADP-ribose pyrophosphatase YjhB (NUDIX family)
VKFCSNCGASSIELAIPEGDNRHRHCCPSCGSIFYQNPKIVAGCIARWQDKILMCRRAIEPRHGLWTLPAGFMENGETVQAAALRETQEEACANVKGLRLYTLYNLPHISQVYMIFLGDLVTADASPGIESLEVALMKEHEIPWEQLAFPVIKETLELYFEDVKNDSIALRTGHITRLPDSTYEICRY